MKTLGAVLVILAGLLLGLRSGERMKSRLGFISSLIDKIQLMHGEICSSLKSVPQTLQLLGADEESPSSVFFSECLSGLENGKTLREAWRDAAESCIAAGITGEDASSLAGLGDVLGRYGAEEQERAFIRLENELERTEKKLKSEIENTFRLRACLGTGAGLALAIILL